MKAAMQLVGVPLVERASWPAPEGSRGLFVVFEGLDRSGKSTQSRQLAKRLEELGGVRWTSFPDRSLLSGALIDLYLRRKLEFPDEAIHMLFCANRWEAAPRILDEIWYTVSASRAPVEGPRPPLPPVARL